MTAIVFREYGSPDTLTAESAPIPVPGAGEVLVRVHAAGVNAADWHIMRGEPRIARLAFGLRRPKDTRLGADVAGVVEAVGPGVTRLAVGDPVFGELVRGAFAEFACAPESKLAAKPTTLSFEQAAAVPMAAMTAFQAVRDTATVQPGERVLINGAAGGVGSFAVQFAKQYGAEVTGVCSTGKVEHVRSLGAAHVIDYTHEDFTRGSARYDVIIDMVGNHPLGALRGVLTKAGRYVSVGGGKGGGKILGLEVKRLMQMAARSPFVSQKLTGHIAKPNVDDLTTIAELIDAGKIVPVIERTFPLAKTADAIRHLEQGSARGKVVVVIPRN